MTSPDDVDQRKLWLVTMTKTSTAYVWAKTEEDALMIVTDHEAESISCIQHIEVEPVTDVPNAADGEMPWGIEDDEEQLAVDELWELQESRR